MIMGPTPLCLRCVRFHEDSVEGFTCDAFPKGIPDEIVLGGFNHNNPFPGDNGMRFLARVKFAVVGPEEPALSAFAQEVLGRITMGSTDPRFVARMRTLTTEIDRAVSGLAPIQRKAVWKAFYTIVDELRSERKRV
jgi:hypothetical protein